MCIEVKSTCICEALKLDLFYNDVQLYVPVIIKAYYMRKEVFRFYLLHHNKNLKVIFFFQPFEHTF